ncbi:MAG: Zn-ribbon domain-containing OB-fold protein [Gemmatimonadetes bacterium]|nr:Zn-ribbon domain-containing OB-fold protein [Gemmatimonadota bacterium]
MAEKDGVPFILDFLPQEGPDETRIHQFYDHLRQGRLTTTRCSSCGEILWQPRVVCPHCNSDAMEWIDLPKEGTIYAHTAMVLGAPLGFEDDLPFVIAIVRLDMGELGHMNLFTRVDDAKYEDLAIGDRLWFKTHDCGDGRVFFRFTPTAPD